MAAEKVKSEMAKLQAEAEAEMEKLQIEKLQAKVNEEEEEEEEEAEIEKLQAEEEEEKFEEEPYSDYSHSAISQEDNDTSSGDGDGGGDENYVPIKMYLLDDDPEDYKTEEYKKFMRTIEESRGYDLPPYPDLKIAVNLLPCRNRTNTRKLARVAIKKYNNRYETEYEFVSFIKGNKQGARGIMYYLTFAVKEKGPDAKLQVFQARVLYGVEGITVYECHPKAVPDATDIYYLTNLGGNLL